MRQFVLLVLLIPMFFVTATQVDVYGFDDFCFDEICYDNPAKDITLELEGTVLTVDSDTVQAVELSGPSLGIGVDPTANHAYISGSAYGTESLASTGPDAGDYACGWLYARLLEEDQCSLFVHVPLNPDSSDLHTVYHTLQLIHACKDQRATMMIEPKQ